MGLLQALHIAVYVRVNIGRDDSEKEKSIWFMEE